MAITRYKNPQDLPIDAEEASTSYLDWFDKEQSKRDSSQAPIFPVHDIVSIPCVGGPTRYFVSGGYATIPKGYTPQ